VHGRCSQCERLYALGLTASRLKGWLRFVAEKGAVVVRVARHARLPVIAVTLLAVAITLAGCVPVAPQPVPTVSRTATPTPTPTETPDPELVAGGTAGQNRPFVEFVISALLESTSQPSSLAIIDTLVAAGFDKASMEITKDTTRVGDPADSILFSVLISGQCLLGQVAQGSVATELGDVLGTGRCLVGRTLSLD